MNWDWEKLQERRQRKPSSQEEEGGDFDKIVNKGVNKLHNLQFPWLKVVLGLFVVLWLLSGIFIVNPDEKGVVMRFGKFVRIVDPGPHYRLPFPIESVYTPMVESIQRMEIGYGQNTSRNRTSNSAGSMDEASMLTGDENIVFVQFVVQFRIDPVHPEYYLFNVADPLTTVRSAAQASMREVMGSTKIDSAITDGRQEIEQRTKDILQGILDDYKAGIIITGVEMQEVHPPKEAIDAFMDVASAREDRSKIINQAEAYRNEILPKARGEAARAINEAEAYRQSVVLKADGEMKRFMAIVEEYNKAKEVTTKRLYLEALEEVFSNPNIEKVIIPEGGSAPILPFLPLSSNISQGQTSK